MQPTDERAAFEAQWPNSPALKRASDGYAKDYTNDYIDLAWKSWQAAIAWERERCAKVCKDLWLEQEAAQGNMAGQFHEGILSGLERAEAAIRKGAT